MWRRVGVVATVDVGPRVAGAGRAPQCQRADHVAVRRRLRRVDETSAGGLVVADDVQLSARTDTGLLHAVQSLRQLLPAQAQPRYRLPRVVIADAPAYRWRGLSLDVARSFLSVAYLEKTIDRMAFFKLNRLHLHLTDDQGWRIEITRYPKLTQIGGVSAVEGGRGGHYTQAQLKHLVAYAQARGITMYGTMGMIAPSVNDSPMIKAACNGRLISALPRPKTFS